MEKKLQKIYLAYYNLLIGQGLWQVLNQKRINFDIL